METVSSISFPCSVKKVFAVDRTRPNPMKVLHIGTIVKRSFISFTCVTVKSRPSLSCSFTLREEDSLMAALSNHLQSKELISYIDTNFPTFILINIKGVYLYVCVCLCM